MGAQTQMNRLVPCSCCSMLDKSRICAKDGVVQVRIGPKVELFGGVSGAVEIPPAELTKVAIPNVSSDSEIGSDFN